MVIKLYKDGHNKSYSDLIAGRSYLAKKEYNNALSAFTKALSKNAVLKNFIYYLMAKAYEAKRDFVSASNYYLKVSNKSIYYRKALSIGLRLLFELRRYTEILSFSGDEKNEVVLYYKAYSALKLNRKDDFYKYYNMLSKDLPGYLYKAYYTLFEKSIYKDITNSAAQALATAYYYKRQYHKSLSLSYKIKNPSYKDLDFRASIYLKLNMPNKASEVYKNILARPNEYKKKAEYMNLLCIKYLGRNSAFRGGLIKIANDKSHPYRISALKNFISYYAKKNDAGYKPLIRELSSSNTELSSFFLGFIKTVSKKNNAASIPDALSFARFSKNRDFKSCVYNFLGDKYLLSGNTKTAVYYFKLSTALSSNMYSALSFNRLEELGKADEELKKEIYYNLLKQKAQSRRGAIFDIKKLENKAPFKSKLCDAFLEAGDKHHARLVALKYLDRTGEHNILSVIKYFRDKKVASVTSYFAIRLMKYLRDRGFYSILYKDLAELSFPPSFKKLYKNVGHPHFLRALTYAESFFDVYAYSRAGAVGLTQKMPSTARSVAKNPALSVYEIFEPKLNIELGDKFISWLLKYFKNKVDALGAYNSGPTRFRRYIRKYKKNAISQAHFIAKIPLDETRGYIKNVLFAYMFIKVTGI